MPHTSLGDLRSPFGPYDSIWSPSKGGTYSRGPDSRRPPWVAHRASGQGADMKRTDLGTVLLDVAPGAGEVFEASFLEKIGHPVRVCHGPAEEPCPLVVGDACEKFEMAHGI